MSSGGELDRGRGPGPLTYGALHGPSKGPSDLADVLERVLDKGIVIAGDIQINLLDIELLNIKLRLLVASVERAREMGINWWESDSGLSSSAKQLEEENRDLRFRLARLEEAAGLPPGGPSRKASTSGSPESGATAYAEAKGEDAEVWTSVDDEEESGGDAGKR
jgi:Gas vesicle protein